MTEADKEHGDCSIRRDGPGGTVINRKYIDAFGLHSIDEAPTSGAGAAGYSPARVAARMAENLGEPELAAKFLELIEDGALMYKVIEEGAIGPAPATKRLKEGRRQGSADYNSLLVGFSKNQHVSVTAAIVAHEMRHLCRARLACTYQDESAVVISDTPTSLYPLQSKGIVDRHHAEDFIEDLIAIVIGDHSDPPPPYHRPQVAQLFITAYNNALAGLKTFYVLEAGVSKEAACEAAALEIKERFLELLDDAKVPDGDPDPSNDPLAPKTPPKSLEKLIGSEHQELLECLFEVEGE